VAAGKRRVAHFGEGHPSVQGVNVCWPKKKDTQLEREGGGSIQRRTADSIPISGKRKKGVASLGMRRHVIKSPESIRGEERAQDTIGFHVRTLSLLV